MTMEQNAIRLLREARRLNNQTVKSTTEVMNWHREVDELLEYMPGEDRQERWDHPPRAAHRDFVKRLTGGQ